MRLGCYRRKDQVRAAGGGSAPPPVQGFYWYGSIGSMQTSRPQE